MNLDEYLKARDKDSNLFWRLASGVHQNLLDEAIYKIEELEAENKRLLTALYQITKTGDWQHTQEIAEEAMEKVLR